MKQKYQKPFARSLGDVLPDAQGYCYNGSVANTAPPTNTDPGCFPGGTATGAGCGFGASPNPVSCNSGQAQRYFGCTNGFQASGGTGMCASGNGVTT